MYCVLTLLAIVLPRSQKAILWVEKCLHVRQAVRIKVALTPTATIALEYVPNRHTRMVDADVAVLSTPMIPAPGGTCLLVVDSAGHGVFFFPTFARAGKPQHRVTVREVVQSHVILTSSVNHHADLALLKNIRLRVPSAELIIEVNAAIDLMPKRQTGRCTNSAECVSF